MREQLFVIASQIEQHSDEFEKEKDAPEVKGFFTLFKRIDTVTAAMLHVGELISKVPYLLPAIPVLLDHLPK